MPRGKRGKIQIKKTTMKRLNTGHLKLLLFYFFKQHNIAA